MPIHGLTDRGASFAQIGSIRKGQPKTEKGYVGQDLTYFRVVFDDAEAESAQRFLSIYGPAPKSLNVFLPFNEVERNFDAYLEAYLAGALVYRSDGVRVLRELDPETGTVLVSNGEPDKPHRPNPVGWYANQKGKKEPIKARPTGRLKIIIPELMRAAYLVLHTTSVHDVINISSQLDGLRLLNGGQLAGIPLVLRRRPVRISTPAGEDNGKRVRREKWLISIEADPKWVEACLARMRQVALPEAAVQLPPALAAPTTLPESTLAGYDDEDDEVVDADVDEPPQSPMAAPMPPESEASQPMATPMIETPPETSGANAAGRSQPPKLSRIQTGAWRVEAEKLAGRVPFYRDKSGKPDWFHMSGAAAKLGIAEITDANLTEVIVMLEQHAQAHAQATAEPAAAEPATEKASA